MRPWEKTAICEPRREVAEEIECADTLIFNVQLPEPWENKCLLLLKPLGLLYFLWRPSQKRAHMGILWSCENNEVLMRPVTRTSLKTPMLSERS